MSVSEAEAHVLHRFAEKCRIAGGAKAGHSLRKQSIEQGWERASLQVLEQALEKLVGDGLLKLNETEDRFFLTPEGAEKLEEDVEALAELA